MIIIETKIVAITACTAGIAHTYMAAESLKKKGESAGYLIRVETQGSIGAENVLSKKEIDEADVVIISADIDINLDRFKNKNIYKCKTIDLIKDPIGVIKNALANKSNTTVQIKQEEIKIEKDDGNFIKHILSGIAYMSPMSMIAGLILAITTLCGIYKNEFGQVVSSSIINNEQLTFVLIKLYEVGQMALTLVIPLFAGFVANSIGDRPAIVPAMIGAYIANSPELLGLDYGGGFVAALIIAFAIGYVVLAIKNVKWPELIKSLLPWLIIPIVSTLISILLAIFIGKPVAEIMTRIYLWISNKNDTYIIVKFIGGAIMGAMIGYGLGGKLNKISMIIGAAVFIDTISSFGINGANFIPQTSAQAAISVAPLGIWLSYILFNNKFSDEDRRISRQCFKKGMLGITEGAIPYVTRYGNIAKIAITLGSALTGGLTAITNCRFFVGIGSPLGAIIGYIEQPLPIITWVLCIFSGVLLTSLILGFSKKQ